MPESFLENIKFPVNSMIHGMKKTLEGNPSVNISNPLIVSPTYLPPNLEGLFERYELFIFKTEDFFEELKSGNRRITVVEDVISTGNSLLEITKLIRETGFILHKILAAFTYDFEKTNTTLEQNNCPVYCGLRFPEVLSYLASNKLLPDHVLSTLHSWYESPFTWRCKE